MSVARPTGRMPFCGSRTVRTWSFAAKAAAQAFMLPFSRRLRPQMIVSRGG